MAKTISNWRHSTSVLETALMYFKLSREVFRGYCILFRLLQSCNFSVYTYTVSRLSLFNLFLNKIASHLVCSNRWTGESETDAEFNNMVLKVLLSCANTCACAQTVTARLLKATRMRKILPKHC